MKQNKVIVYTSPLSLPPKVRSAGCCWVVPQVEQPSRSVILGQRLVRGVADTSPAPSEPSHHPPSRTWSRPTWTIVACIYIISTHRIYTLYPHCISPVPHLDDHGLHLLAVPPHLALAAPPPLLLHTRPRPGPALAQPPPPPLAAAGGRGGAVLVQLEHKQYRQIRRRRGRPATVQHYRK